MWRAIDAPDAGLADLQASFDRRIAEIFDQRVAPRYPKISLERFQAALLLQTRKRLGKESRNFPSP